MNDSKKSMGVDMNYENKIGIMSEILQNIGFVSDWKLEKSMQTTPEVVFTLFRSWKVELPLSGNGEDMSGFKNFVKQLKDDILNSPFFAKEIKVRDEQILNLETQVAKLRKYAIHYNLEYELQNGKAR